MKCVEVCPNKALKTVNGEMFFLREFCKVCGKCTEVCFFGATSCIGKLMNIKAVLEVIERDTAFYKRSNGGVTFSGGEPMLQIDFLKELLKNVKQESSIPQLTQLVMYHGNILKKLYLIQIFFYMT